MGIQGLLQSLRPIEKTIHITEYKGKTVAIDGHCILHRGCFGAATSLALNKPTESYVDYFLHYIRLFEYHGITPIVVFDGLPLPLKRGTNDERHRRRQDALEKGLALYKQGKVTEAEKHFQQSVAITDEIIKIVARKLIQQKVQCIMAPNEADAQLAHLSNTGKVDAVVTEDSDLLAFGCKKCIFKLDRYGNCVEISLDQVMHDRASIFYNYDAETIRHICILAGCDYLPNVKGIGLKTVLKYYEKRPDTASALLHLRYKYKKDFPRDYLENFYVANLGFLHQWVYDIDEQNYVRLHPLSTECSDLDIAKLGRIPTVEDSTMYRVNRIVPKIKPKEAPKETLKESITKEFIAYAETTKENIVPPNLSPSGPSPSASTSSKSSKSTLKSQSKSPLNATLSTSPPIKPNNAGPLTETGPYQRRTSNSLATPRLNPTALYHAFIASREAKANAKEKAKDAPPPVPPKDTPPPVTPKTAEPSVLVQSASAAPQSEPASGSSQSAPPPTLSEQSQKLHALYRRNGVLPRVQPKHSGSEPLAHTEKASRYTPGSLTSRILSIRRRTSASDYTSLYVKNRESKKQAAKEQNESLVPTPVPGTLSRIRKIQRQIAAVKEIFNTDDDLSDTNSCKMPTLSSEKKILDIADDDDLSDTKSCPTPILSSQIKLQQQQQQEPAPVTASSGAVNNNTKNYHQSNVHASSSSLEPQSHQKERPETSSSASNSYQNERRQTSSSSASAVYHTERLQPSSSSNSSNSLISSPPALSYHQERRRSSSSLSSSFSSPPATPVNQSLAPNQESSRKRSLHDYKKQQQEQDDSYSVTATKHVRRFPSSPPPQLRGATATLSRHHQPSRPIFHHTKQGQQLRKRSYQDSQDDENQNDSGSRKRLFRS